MQIDASVEVRAEKRRILNVLLRLMQGCLHFPCVPCGLRAVRGRLAVFRHLRKA